MLIPWKVFFGQHQSPPQKVSPELSPSWGCLLYFRMLTAMADAQGILEEEDQRKSRSACPHADPFFWWVHFLKLIAVRTWRNGGLVNEAFPKFWEPALHSRCCVSFRNFDANGPRYQPTISDSFGKEEFVWVECFWKDKLKTFLFLFPTKFGSSGKLPATIYSDMLHKILKYDNVLGPWFKGLLVERLIGFFNLTIGSSEKSLLGCMARNSQLFLGCLCYMESKEPTLPMPSPLKK